MILEIASQSSQLDAYKTVQNIEMEKRAEHQQQKKKLEEEVEMKRSREAHHEQQLIDEEEMETEDLFRKSLIQDAINEANDNGTPLSPAILRLINHLKCRYS